MSTVGFELTNCNLDMVYDEEVQVASMMHLLNYHTVLCLSLLFFYNFKMSGS
jgi:hypothetical protein